MHYYQFNIGDYLSHTRHLSLMEDLAYRRMLELYYLHERPFGDCVASVARMIGMTDYIEEVDRVLVEFFEHIDGSFVNPRADKEIAAYHSKIEQASRAGKASAERRSSKRSTGVQPTKNHKPVTKKQEQKDLYKPEFEQFWSAYPEKTGKGAAYTSWQKINPDVQLQSTIMAAVAAYKLSKKVKDGFVKNPATWLNQRCWEDEFPKDEAVSPFAGDI